jgi:hypothetical protein
MKRFTPACLAAMTIGSKQSKLMLRLSDSSNSKLGSFEMQAMWMTVSMPAQACLNAAVSRMSALSTVSWGCRGRPASPKSMRSYTVTA